VLLHGEDVVSEELLLVCAERRDEQGQSVFLLPAKA
jgi:hypothetical protein